MYLNVSPHTGHSSVPSPDVCRNNFLSLCHMGFLQEVFQRGCRCTLMFTHTHKHTHTHHINNIYLCSVYLRLGLLTFLSSVVHVRRVFYGCCVFFGGVTCTSLRGVAQAVGSISAAFTSFSFYVDLTATQTCDRSTSHVGRLVTWPSVERTNGVTVAGCVTSRRLLCCRMTRRNDVSRFLSSVWSAYGS